MEVNQRRNKQKKKYSNEPDRMNKEFDNLQLPSPSPRSKASSCCSGSISMISCLSKAASMKSYSIAPFSPEYSFRVRSIGSRSHSGPIISIIPKEVMGKKKGSGFESQEPTSPKVSCIGQVKLKTKGTCKDTKIRSSAIVDYKRIPFHSKNRKDKDRSKDRSPLPPKERRAELGRMFKLIRNFMGKMKTEKPVSAQPPKALKEGEGNDYPSPVQMKRFASRRESPALANVYAHSEDLVKKNDESGASYEDDEGNEVNLSSVIDELKSRTNSEILLWERSHIECTQTPSPETR